MVKDHVEDDVVEDFFLWLVNVFIDKPDNFIYIISHLFRVEIGYYFFAIKSTMECK